MKIELTKLEYELLIIFKELRTEEKTIVLASAHKQLSEQETSASPALKAV